MARSRISDDVWTAADRLGMEYRLDDAAHILAAIMRREAGGAP